MSNKYVRVLKSLDISIYEAVYTDYTVIARDGCDKVIEATKTFQENSSLHYNKVYGIIDRDYRSDEEIKNLKNNRIYTLDLAEIENLFCIIELIEIIAENQGKEKNEVIEKITDFVIKKLEDNLEEQISKRTASEIGYRLNILSNQKIQGKENMKNEFNKVTNNLLNELDEIYDRNQKLYNDIIESKDYTKALKFYNNKGISKEIDRFLGLSKDYTKLVIRLLQGSKKEEITNALEKYLPRFV